METEINIANILKNKPNGTKLYADAFGELSFECIKDNQDDSIYTKSKTFSSLTFYSNGKYAKEGEPILVPSKEMRDWSKFAWKKGDILVSNDGKSHIIFNRWCNDNYITFSGKHYLNNENKNNAFYYKVCICSTNTYSLEDKDTAKAYINAIEERLSGKLNLKTLTIEDIKTEYQFKPFEKVLVRDSYDDEWRASFFSHFKESDRRFVSTYLTWKYCIPYEGNESLLGTTKDVEE